MNTLDLRPNWLVNTNPMDTAAVAAPMLWPDDPEKQAAYRDCVKADFLARNPQNVATIAEAVALRWVPRLRDFDILEQIDHGMIAGSRLRTTIGRLLVGAANAGSEQVKEDISNSLCPQQGAYTGDSKEMIHKKSKPFAPVLHLWAAFVELKGEAGLLPFPCELDQLDKLLKMAKYYQQLGQKITLKYAKSPLLRADKTIDIPIEIPAEIINGALAQIASQGEPSR